MSSTFCVLNIDDLIFDPENPRIALSVEMMNGNITDESIKLALGAGSGRQGSSDSPTTYASLKESIRTNGGIIHPIIVNSSSDNKYVVIEGNTRLQIYREFRDTKIKGSWSTIPAIVYDNLSIQDIEAIRLQAHLVGPRDWDPYSKAKYLNLLYIKQNLTLAQIVDFCGGNKTSVNYYINAYRDMEQYYRPLLNDQEFDHTRFSAFVELQKLSIQQAILSHGFSKSDFAQWVIDDLFGPLHNIRALPRVLTNPKCRQVFLTEGMEEALKILNATSPSVALSEASLYQLAREISLKIAGVPYQYVLKLRSGSIDDEKESILDAKDSLVGFSDDIDEE